jgi:polyisoprenoid-binding protein YceI
LREFEQPPFFDALPRLSHSGLTIPPTLGADAKSAADRATRIELPIWAEGRNRLDRHEWRAYGAARHGGRSSPGSQVAHSFVREHAQMQKRKRWIIIGVVAAVVVIGGGLLAINLIQGEGDAPLTFDDITTTVASGGTTSPPTSALTSLDGTWNVASGSTAGYRVKETLVGQSTDATGRTTAVTGEFTLAGTTVSTASFSVDMTQVTSNRSQRDGQFQGRIMETSQFPTATFELTEPIDFGSLPASGVEITPKATGELTLHGVTKTVTIPLKAKRSGNSIQVLGSLDLTFADYGIDDPSGGPASVGTTGTLEFALLLTQA